MLCFMSLKAANTWYAQTAVGESSRGKNTRECPFAGDKIHAMCTASIVIKALRALHALYCCL